MSGIYFSWQISILVFAWYEFDVCLHLDSSRRHLGEKDMSAWSLFERWSQEAGVRGRNEIGREETQYKVHQQASYKSRQLETPLWDLCRTRPRRFPPQEQGIYSPTSSVTGWTASGLKKRMLVPQRLWPDNHYGQRGLWCPEKNLRQRCGQSEGGWCEQEWEGPKEAGQLQ